MNRQAAFEIWDRGPRSGAAKRVIGTIANRSPASGLATWSSEAEVAQDSEGAYFCER